MRLRAVVLAAGFGTRLRPLTETQPKGALPVAGRPVAGRTLELLARAGCEAAAVNLHHLGGPLRAALGEEVEGMPLTYSEEEEIRGTLGALWPLRDFFSAADLVLVINGDSLCRWPLRRLLSAHRKGGAAATLLLAARADPARFGGGVAVAGDGAIVTFRSTPAAGTRRRVFAGAHVLAPARLAELADRPADFVSDLYQPLLERGGRLVGVETRRPWHDLGTPERYRRAVLGWLFGGRPWRRRWLGGGARVAEGARLSRVAVEAGAVIEGGARLRGSVVLPGARVGREAVVRRSLLGRDVVLPAGAEVEGQLVTPAGTGRGGGSRIGDLVFTPLAD